MADAATKRILVVDDAALVRLYYRNALEAAGFDVDEAMNGLEALEKLLMAPADLVIVDVNMPQMDGITFLEVLRAMPLPLAATPALLTSTEHAPQRVAAARRAGANFYAVKPLSREKLVAYVALLSGAGHG
jgi:two-component system chemotaxis response regulator CheY